MDACPRDAIERTDIGWVWINPAKCDPTSCGGPGPRPCELSCPWSIPRREYTAGATPYSVEARKCDGCFDRWQNEELEGVYDPPDPQQGGRFNGTPFTLSNRPACVLACPTNALKANKLKKMRTKAEKRVRYLRRHGFPDANLYRGSWEGLCIWVLPEKKEKYGITS
jgi:Fe-S-cluster-containing dehydrogenase component